MVDKKVNGANNSVIGAEVFGSAVAAMNAFARTAEMLLETQTRTLGTVESMASEWLAHRRKQIESLLATVQEISVCQDPAEMTRIQARWLTETLNNATTELSSVGSSVLAAASSVVAEPDKPSLSRKAG
jgi:hypothetical protein